MKKYLILFFMIGFLFVLHGCNNSKNEDLSKVKEARDTLLLSDNNQVIDENISLPEVISGYSEVIIEWSSDNIDYLSHDGIITRPKNNLGDQTVTMKATLSKNEAEATKEFTIHIKALEFVNEYTSISEFYESSILDDKLVLQGIITLIYDDYIVLTDNGVNLLLNPQGISINYELGDKVEIVGYHNKTNQLHLVDDIESFKVVSSGNEIICESEEYGIKDIWELDTKDSSNLGNIYEVTGELVVNEDNTFSLNSLESDKSLDILQNIYGTALVDLTALDREIVKMDLFYLTKNTSENPSMIFNNTGIEVLELNFQEEFDSDIVETINDIVSYQEDIILKLEGANHTTFSEWTSDHPDLINDNGEFIKSPEHMTVITFEGKANLRQYTQDVSFEVTMPGPSESIDSALTNNDGEFVHIQGIVTSFNPHDKGFFIQNETDDKGLFIFYDSTNANIEVGDRVSIYGQLGRNTGYKNNQRMLGGDILITNGEVSSQTFTIIEAKPEDIINNYNYYDISKPLNQEGGTTDGLRYTIKDVTLNSLDAFNYVYINSEETNMALVFDIEKVEGLTIEEYSDNLAIESITFTTERMYFGNYRIVDVIINQ